MPPNSPDHPTAVALYGVRDHLAADPLTTLERLARIGFRHAEPFGITERLDSLKTARQATGFTFATAHSGLIGHDVGPVFDAANELGVSTVIDPFTEPDLWRDPANVDGIAEALNVMVSDATSRGLRLAYHNHWWEVKNRIGDRTALEYFADRLDPAIVLQVDTYWAAVGGEAPEALLKRLGDRVVALHIKDGDFSLDGTGQTPAGDGRVDIPPVLAAAPEAQRIIEFDSFDGDVFQAIADSLTYLRRVDR